MLQELNHLEMVSIDGGHDGAAFEAGEAVGKFMTKLAIAMSIGVLILAPKS